MKMHVLLYVLLALCVLPSASAFADDHEWDNGGGNDGQTAQVDAANDGHSGDEAQ